MENKGRGWFVVIDGLDGIGKGVIEKSLVDYEISQGRKVFDTVGYSIKNGIIPTYDDVKGYDTITTAEPTRAGIGKIIREEMVAKNGREYSVETQIESYSLDRLFQMRRLVVPCLENGINVIQSRSVASTLCYQSLKARIDGGNIGTIREAILRHEGNRLQLHNAPGLLIIPTIADVDELMERIEKRKKTDGKDDNCEFENPEFQKALKPFYEEKWVGELFAFYGTSVKYLDAGISKESTAEQAVELYKNFLAGRK
jgi:thymidylate kinase